MWHDIFQTYADAMQVAMMQAPAKALQRHHEGRFVADERAGFLRGLLKQSQQSALLLKSFRNG